MENTRAGRDVTCQYRRGVPRACHPSQSHACLGIWASTPGGGAGMGAYTLPALGSVAGPVWVWSRARFTHGQIRGSTQDREATQRNLGEETRLGGNERAEERSTLILGTARHARSSHNHITSYQSRCAALVVTFTHGVYGHTCSSHNHIGFRINPDVQH